MKNIQKTIETLETHNKWRRGEEDFTMLDPTEIGIAIDDACEMLKEHDQQVTKLKEELTKAVNECIKLTRVVNEYNKNKV